MRARVSLLTTLAVLSAACGATDVVARVALEGCDGALCAPEDAGQDASDAGDAGGGTCAAATCSSLLACDRPVPRAIVGDGCGEQPWAAPGFRHALCACGDLVSEFPLTVERSAKSEAQGPAPVAVDGMLTVGGPVEIAGGLYVAGAIQEGDAASIDAAGVQADTGQARCDCGADVALAPSAVRALVPENPTGFDPDRFANVQTDETVALSCGAYRVPTIAGPSGLNLAIDGHVVLVVEGDVQLDANLEVTLAPGALLELFVLGNVRVAGAMILGDDDDAVRLYVLGPGTIDLNAEAFIAGPLYAPNAELVTRSDLTTTGAIFVRRAAPGGPLTIRYDSATARASSCAAP